MESRFSASVKGKRDLARSKATKWLSKGDLGGVGKHLPNTTAIGDPRGRTGDGERSSESFQFSAGGQVEMDKQDQRQECVSGGGSGGDQNEAIGCEVMDQSEATVRDGVQNKIDPSVTH
nr:hypothetical protein CFP56_74167 [Quercus suber]